ncbi:HNH endonuclease [Microbacterium sp. No. 7]|uniref:HNH endonuclease n=1 Tax=Microbacterium sp. No. 7 TaxID=1714373 RepID=UPI0009EB768E|nr:HNH endonuclease signature motif containing protein [Microbacterium sp. No. 7]
MSHPQPLDGPRSTAAAAGSTVHRPPRELCRADEVVDAFVAAARERSALDAREIRILARAAELIGGDGPRSEVTRDLARRSLIAELAAATRMSEWTVTRLLNQAVDVCARFRVAVDAVERGEISRIHLLTIYEAGADIEDDARVAEYVTHALGKARVLTPGRLRPIVTGLAERYRDRSLAERAARAAERRRAGVRDLSDGLAELFAILPATLAHAIDDRLTQQARAIRDERDRGRRTHQDALDGVTLADAGVPDTGVTDTGVADAGVADADVAERDGDRARDGGGDDVRETDGDEGNRGNDGSDGDDRNDGRDGDDGSDGNAGRDGDDDDRPSADTRTLDQLRADVLTDLLLTGTPDTCLGGDGLGHIRANVTITIPVLSMAGDSTEPCILAGHGPIDPVTAARLAGAASGWDRVMTSPLDGAVLATDRYRPPEALRRFLRARDEHCRFPGCRRNAVRCDVDHTIDAARGGPTTPGNTAHLCRRHHTVKHHTAWSVRQEAPGVLVWTSPSGRRHTDRPEPTVRFVPEHALPPPPPRTRRWYADLPSATDAPF